jgi:hypothetical protein
VKVWDPRDFQALKNDVATTFSLLEWELLVALFDIMTHLTLHVVEKLDVYGLVDARWMYPIEQTLKMFKTYVRNKARPEASMAERCLLMKPLGLSQNTCKIFHMFGTRYGMQTKKREGVCSEVLEGARIKFILDSGCRDLAHQYVLTNASCMAPWVW